MSTQLATAYPMVNTLDQVCEPMVDQINHLAQDPAIGAELARLQAEGYALLNGIIEDITVTLNNLESSVSPPPNSGPQTAATLRSDARERENNARERRELARDMVIESLAGLDCDGSLDLDRQRFFLALLQADVIR